MDELESWDARFDPSWWLLLGLQNPSVDQHVATKVTSHVRSLGTLKTLRDELAAQETQTQSARFKFLHMETLVEDREDTSYSKSTLACLDGSLPYVFMDTVTRDPHVDPAVISRKPGEHHGIHRSFSLQPLSVSRRHQALATIRNPRGV